MYNVSEQYHSLIANGAEQNLLIIFNDLYFSGLDHDFEASGAQLNEYFNTSTDIEIGEVASSTFSVNILNLDGHLNSFNFGEGRPYIGVKTGTGVYSRPSGATCFSVFTDSNGESHDVVGYNDHLVIDGVTYSTDSKAVTIMWSREDLLYVQTTDAMYEYSYDFATDVWTISTGALNPVMAAKEAEGVSFRNNILIRYLDDGTTETWEYCPLGVFTFETPVKRQVPVISVSAYDRMASFDMDASGYLSRTWSFPVTLEDIFTSLCDYVGVPYSLTSNTLLHRYEPNTLTLGGSIGASYSSNVLTLTGVSHAYSSYKITLSSSSSTFTNADMSFTALPTFSPSATCRDILAYVAEAAGAVAVFDRDGVLRLRWYGDIAMVVVDGSNIPSNGYDMAEYTTPMVGQITAKLANGEIYTEGSGDNVYTILANSFLASDASRYAAVLSKLQTVGAYIPIVSDIITADPSIEAGDRATILDNTVPLMNQTITWRGYTAATYTATGLAKRELPSSMDRYDYAVAYNQSRTDGNTSEIIEINNSLFSDEDGLLMKVDTVIGVANATAEQLGELSEEYAQYVAANEDGLATAINIHGHIRSGIVGYENGVPITGVAIGKEITTTTQGGEEVLVKKNVGVYTDSDVSFYVGDDNGTGIMAAQFGANGAYLSGDLRLGSHWRWYIEPDSNGDDMLNHKYTS